jgi:hypothetical protein
MSDSKQAPAAPVARDPTEDECIRDGPAPKSGFFYEEDITEDLCIRLKLRRLMRSGK